jgi:HAD superfamily hydrolase (TIGR01509 family)
MILRTVLLDWDGTLLDSYHADAQAYLAMFRAMGIDWDLDDLARHYSPDWYRLYRAAGLPRARWEEADRTWREHYERQKPTLLPGARNVLQELKGTYQLGLVSSGSRWRVLGQLRAFGLTRLFAARVCGGDTPQRKPHPAPLQLALERLRVDPRSCVYVGDAPEDLEMARRAGVRAIAVLGPFPTAKRVRAAKPEFLLGSIQELPELLRRLGQRVQVKRKPSAG